jgi:hypothetical protein
LKTTLPQLTSLTHFASSAFLNSPDPSSMPAPNFDLDCENGEDDDEESLLSLRSRALLQEHRLALLEIIF